MVSPGVINGSSSSNIDSGSMASREPVIRFDGLTEPSGRIYKYPEWAQKDYREYNNGIAPPSDDLFKLSVIELLRSINTNTYNTAIYGPRERKPERIESGFTLGDPSLALPQGGRRKTRRHKKTRRHR
jgi:hypothetical protein